MEGYSAIGYQFITIGYIKKFMTTMTPIMIQFDNDLHTPHMAYMHWFSLNDVVFMSLLGFEG